MTKIFKKYRTKDPQSK